MTLRVLSLSEIKQSITMNQAISVMEMAFKELYEKKAILPLRTPIAVAKENALMLTMPAYLSEQNALGLKVVSIFPNNNTKNKPAINGVMLLVDECTGEAKAIMDAGYLTALRTGAVSGLATKYLAREDAKHVAIIGSGVQAHTQLAAVTNVRNIERVSVWSRNHENAVEFAKSIDDQYQVECFQQVQEAVRDADVICTATGSTTPLIHLQDIKPDVHINAVGSHTLQMNEISTEVLAQAFIVVDQLEAALAESGEIYAAMNAKAISAQDIIELGAFISTQQKLTHPKISMFKSVGLAIQDISVAQAVYENALTQGLGKLISLYD